MWLITLTIPILLIICFQDFKNREIYWWLPVVLFLAELLLSLFSGNIKVTTGLILKNTILLITQYCFLVLYFSIKKKKLTSVADEFLGWGDILFLLAITPVFAPLNMMGFLILSICLSLILFLIKQKKNEEQYLIPFAGVMSVVLILFKVYYFINPGFDLKDEYLIAELLL